MALQPGQTLNDRYRIVRIIKSGGMGSVYEAIDTKLADSPCAVKEIHEAAQASRDAEYIQGRFFEEMKALVALDHGSIPKVRDYLTQDSTIYIVMELVQGRSLDEEIQERVRNEAPAPIDYIVLDMVRLLETLAYLHGQEPPVIHRDIKPANILRDQRSGTIKLVDFGLARSLHGPNTQTVVGTMGYCAPEQLMGKSEQRSDLYAVGVTMVHMLTGRPPEMELFEARRPELPGVRPGLEEIIEKATQPKPQDRYATAEEMIEALQAWLHGASAKLTARLPEPVARSPLVVPPWAGKALAALVVLGSLGLGVYAGQNRNSATASRALAPAANSGPQGEASSRALSHVHSQQKLVARLKPPPPPDPPYQPPVANYSPPARHYQAPSRPVSAPKPNYRPPSPPAAVVQYSPPPAPYSPPKHGHGNGRPKHSNRQPQPSIQVQSSGGGIRISSPRIDNQIRQAQQQINNSPIRGIHFP